MTQRELADRVGATLWTLDEIEAGRQAPDRYAERIETILGRPRGWLEAAEPEGTSAGAVSAGARAERVDLRGRDLVLAALAILVTVRFFTESIGVLPSAGNFIDILLLPVLLGAALLAPWRGVSRFPRDSPYPLLALAFFGICAISVVLNTSRVAYGPIALFLYGFLGPLLFYYAAFKLWPVGHALSLSRLIVGLGVLQFAVVLTFDLPAFAASRNPDEIVGTFGGNAYQLVFFLLVFSALVAGIAAFEPKRRTARYAPLIFLATFLVIFLAQYRALVVATAVVIVVIALMLRHASGKGVLVGAAVVLAFVAGFGYVATNFPEFRFLPTLEALRADPTSFVAARLDPARDIASLYGDDPRFIATGTGPGTFSSRAWRTFAEIGDPSSAEGAAQPYASALTGGEAYRTDVSERYIVPRNRRAQVILGSTALTSPYSSYLALLAEVGLVGFALMVAMYLLALLESWRIANWSISTHDRGDSLPALALATLVGFLLLMQMAALENWWEVARVTVPSWILLAVCTKEFASRSRRAL